MSAKKVSIGIVGFGEFSLSHLEIFMAHPDVIKVVGAEILDDRRKFVEEKYKIKMYKTYEEMLENEPDLNSVGIFSQRHQHGPMIIQGLKAGKNVFTAVPMGCTVDEIFEILDLVEKTGLTFSMGETCYYFPCTVWNRKRIKEGVLGDVTYGEAQYYHNITEFLSSYESSGKNMNKEIGIPPMYYGTHSASMLISSIGSAPAEISCFGYTDKIGDGFYGKGANNWNNPFSNQTAIVRFKNGALGRLNEFRRIGSLKPSSFITGIYGTKGTYECSGNQHLLTIGHTFGQEADSIDVSDEINTFSFIEDKGKIDPKLGRMSYKYHTGFSPIHNVERLPEIFRKMENDLRKRGILNTIGHNGSHFFTIDDFVKAVVLDKIPPVNAWRSAEYTLTGILAHESAINNNKTMKFPEVGNPPADKEVLDFD